jgi:hypothetical protein
MSNEPVSIVAAITAAITSTLAILLFVGVDPELVGAITLATTAWVGVAAAVVRSRVSPVVKPPPADRGSISVTDVVVVLVGIAVVVWLVRNV